jgi:myo-inositol 2-dehydrogenase / D-chiro-inositol 1-dehydrogenase
MLDVALVGLGDIGLSAHLPALDRHPDVRVAALIDPDPQRRERVLKIQDDVVVAADLDDALAAGVVAVVLATPPWVTPDLTLRATRAGRFVLAEKPVATSVAAAAIYDQLTEAERARVQVGLTYRHDPAIAQLRDWVSSGRLGRPLLVRAQIYDEVLDPADSEHAQRIRTTLAHGPPVVHEGAHVFDWLTVVLDASGPRVVDAWSLQTDRESPAPNLIGARLAYPDDTTALVEFGWLTAAQPATELSVLGPRGYAVLDGDTFGLRLSTSDGVEAVDFPGDRVERCFDRQLNAFVDLTEGRRRTPEPDLAAGRAALATAEDVVRCAGHVGRTVGPSEADGAPSEADGGPSEADGRAKWGGSAGGAGSAWT